MQREERNLRSSTLLCEAEPLSARDRDALHVEMSDHGCRPRAGAQPAAAPGFALRNDLTSVHQYSYGITFSFTLPLSTVIREPTRNVILPRRKFSCCIEISVYRQTRARESPTVASGRVPASAALSSFHTHHKEHRPILGVAAFKLGHEGAGLDLGWGWGRASVGVRLMEGYN